MKRVYGLIKLSGQFTYLIPGDYSHHWWPSSAVSVLLLISLGMVGLLTLLLRRSGLGCEGDLADLGAELVVVAWVLGLDLSELGLLVAVSTKLVHELLLVRYHILGKLRRRLHAWSLSMSASG